MRNYIYHLDGSTDKDAIFVFGSNLRGVHGAGAALAARNHFNAKPGIGEGLTGRSYAIPTKDYEIETLPLRDITDSVERFKAFAKENPSMRFFITRVGCGLAGYNDSDIAPLFIGSPTNCDFPMEWQFFLED